MTRPKKQTIDYFPHDCDCSNKKTLYILEQKYGNNGYAFWFKLLEILGSTEGHVVDCSNPVAWQFLQAKTRTSGVICEEILLLLVEVGAIDRELWESKCIWSDNFVERIEPVYLNRKSKTPTKPTSKGITTGRNPTKEGITTRRNPQSKVKESKVKESKGKERKKDKRLFHDFIFLTDQEYDKLIERFGKDYALDRINNINDYAHQIGEKKFKVKYDSHYHTILNWERKNDGKNNRASKRQSVEKAQSKSEGQVKRPTVITIED